MTLSVEEKKAIAFDVLRGVREQCDKAIIAGGFARDLLIMAEPRDVDIWFYHKLEIGDLLLYLDRLRYDEVHWVRSHSYMKNDFAGGLYELHKLSIDGLSVDLLRTQHLEVTPVALLDTFDFGICRVGLTHDQQFVTRASFFEDRFHKTLTCFPGARPDQNMKRVLGTHLKRLRAKFPGYKFRWDPTLSDELRNHYENTFSEYLSTDLERLRAGSNGVNDSELLGRSGGE